MAHYITRQELKDGLYIVMNAYCTDPKTFSYLGLLEIQANAVPELKDAVHAIQDAVEIWQNEDDSDASDRAFRLAIANVHDSLTPTI